MTPLAAVAARLRAELGDHAVITDRQELRTYECDGLAHYRVTPGLVVLPETTRQVAAVVRACAEGGVPFVARGSGTGLSGGALPHADGVLVVTSRMRRILEVDIDSQRAVVQPGVVNVAVTAAAAPHGYYYAPDPSSQQVCSIGGNVAENSGGAHCLKYGFTTNHVLGLELVTPDGDIVQLGGKAPDPPGYDLLGVLVGSEGTLGIATAVTVRLVRAPESVRTLLAGFASVLGHCAGQDDLVIGTPVAGRTRPEIEGLIGFFVNLLPLRIDLAGEPTYRELLARVRGLALAAFDHQVGFQKLAFSPDGSWLGMLVRDGTLHLWHAPKLAEIVPKP